MIWSMVRFLLPVLSPRWLERRRIESARRVDPVVSPPAKPSGRLLVDLTTIARHDARSGIQRVVRSTVTQMRSRSRGADIQAVRYERGAFRHTAWPAAEVTPDVIMNPRPGDIFLGLDLSFDAVRRNAKQFLRYKRSGTRFWFVIYDLLPLQSPQYFSAKVAVRFRWWLVATARLAEGYICISPHVADELRTVLAQRFAMRDEVAIEVIPMGFDSLSAGKPPVQEADLATVISAKEVVLAVGTLEPRKGYGLLIDAFELLWERGSDATLVIVGRSGWKTEALRRRILNHPDFGRRLHWLPTLDDAGLAILYECASALVAASYGEGFGLPVLEAVARSCPVLARDIPAFRVHARHGLRYFPADAGPGQLADAIAETLHDSTALRTSASPAPLPQWRETADTILGLLGHDLVTAKRE
ncbi:glycosyltransferase family 4 protein [Sphingobium sp. B11D3D]|uniref:glycosyltransferase family 4 protein n=2 Tax=unclassified Sphingobium TaxID=2611147 RepID=UPI0022258380|nr:glycosyltransferase family 1 protein [Sphingobium sp. B11D3D]